MVPLQTSALSSVRISGNNRNALPLADTYAIDERGMALVGDEPNVGVPVFTGTSWVGRATPLEIELAEFVGLGGLDIIDVGSPDIRSIGLRINNAGMDATMPGHFYALSEVITAVPEPQTGVAMFLGVITLAACLRKRHARRISPEFLGREFRPKFVNGILSFLVLCVPACCIRASAFPSQPAASAPLRFHPSLLHPRS